MLAFARYNISILAKLISALAMGVIVGYGIGFLPVWASHDPCSGASKYFHIHWMREILADVTHQISILDENGATGEYEPAVEAAVDNWNAEQGHVEFVDPTGVSKTYIVVDYDTSSAAGWVSTNPSHCSDSSTHLNTSDAIINSRVIEDDIDGGDPEDLRQKVAVHELGHTIGLVHPIFSNTTAIMKPGWNGYYWVRDWDVQMLDFNSDPYGHSD